MSARRSRRRSKNNPIAVIVFLILSAFFAYTRQETPVKTPPVKVTESSFTGKCVGVTDGDTIKVMYQGREQKVRLHGVDTPEKKQAYGSVAKQFTSKMVFGKNVTVQVRDHDRYGRTVGWVILPDGRALNLELVKAGMAWWYRDYARSDNELAEAEKQARDAKRGLWSQNKPVAPWDYRRRYR